ncbi:MAG: molybdopterin-guanine dinucleotide biosynthesis protein B [Syntrophomonas sp.]|nr:molybdopterin-guanine dinucleotide biosynthesis protein B [Syntrophomonas sp.]
MIPVISLVGYADSGKTTLMAGLIGILKSKGYKVAAVKHASHGYTMDTAGTDSWHYVEAGADKVMVAGPSSLTMHELYQDIMPLKDMLKRIKDVDIILVEGFKNEPGPKIEIYRHDQSLGRLSLGEDLVAVVSDIELSGDIPCFSMERLGEMADFIITRLGIKNHM